MTIKYFIKFISLSDFHFIQRNTIPKIGNPNTKIIKKGIPSPKAHFICETSQHFILKSHSNNYSPSISLQLKIERMIETVFEYIANKIVRKETTNSHQRRTHFHKMHLTIKLKNKKSPISKNGKKELMKALNKNGLEPKKFSLD